MRRHNLVGEAPERPENSSGATGVGEFKAHARPMRVRAAGLRVFEDPLAERRASTWHWTYDRPRLGERIGVAGRWVRLAGGFVRIIDPFGSLALPARRRHLLSLG